MTQLDVRGVSVRFGGVQALNEVDLHVPSGSITGLIGPNGAGKTTLFNVITGLQEPTCGSVRLDDVDLTRTRPHQRARLGIARTFQRLEVFGSLTAYENLLVAAEIHRGWNHSAPEPSGVAVEILTRVGLRPVANERVDAMPTGLARRVELGRALASGPKVLLLDEPSSGLDDHETKDFATLLTDLAADGLAVLLVEHDVALVMDVCQQVHVLDFGVILAVGSPDEIQSSHAVQAAYLGSGGVSTNGNKRRASRRTARTR